MNGMDRTNLLSVAETTLTQVHDNRLLAPVRSLVKALKRETPSHAEIVVCVTRLMKLFRRYDPKATFGSEAHQDTENFKALIDVILTMSI